MKPIKVDLLNPRTAAYECLHIIPMNKGVQSNIATIVSNRIWMKVLYFNESR